MKKKIKVLRIISSLDPRFGGPSKTIIDSSLDLINEGFEVDILTHDKKNSKFTKNKNIKIINKGPGIGNYRFNFKFFFWLLKNRNFYDIFIIHGLWEFNLLIARFLLKNNYYVFTHGQLDPFFKTQIFKKIKKQVYWFLCEKKNLLFSKSLLLTSENEKKLLKNTFVDTNNIKKTIIRYGIKKPIFNKEKSLKKFYKKFPQLKHKKFFLYLGRFHEKKGCEILIKSIKKMIDNKLEVYVFLAGPQNKYKDDLKILSKKYNLSKYLIWSDIILNEMKWGAILASNAMVLSSHGENFGVSLVESLSCSKPVLTTNKVNIYREIEKFKAGFISNNNVNSFYDILKKFKNLNKDQVAAMNRNSLECFNKSFNLSSRANSFGKFLIKNYFNTKKN